MTEQRKPSRPDVEGLRKRNVSFLAHSDVQAREAVLELNAQEEHSTKKEEDKKTFGRTPDGTGRYLRYVSDSTSAKTTVEDLANGNL